MSNLTALKPVLIWISCHLIRKKLVGVHDETVAVRLPFLEREELKKLNV